jgi:aminopeptidase YwaD
VRRRPTVLFAATAAAVLILLTGCEDGANATARTGTTGVTATATIAPTSLSEAGASPDASATSTATEAPRGGSRDSQAVATTDVARALRHIEYLAVTIGSRPAGSEQEREAAAYIAGVLEEAGYQVHLEEFQFDSQVDESTLTIPGAAPLAAIAMQAEDRLEAAGVAVFGGFGRDDDLANVAIDGRVVVYDRGIVTFRDKVIAAEAAGAVAVVVVNDRDGLFRGSLGDYRASIPVLGVSGADREAVMAAIGGPITVSVIAGTQTQVSQNVVASATGGQCEAYLGAHYDSVPQGPGANDNASGVAVVLEIARLHRREGLCVIAFGAEEVGLFGSRDYVAQHLAGSAAFMLNVDMAGRDDGAVVVGNNDLTEAILNAIADAGVASTLRPGTFPPFASSDHVSFEAVGVPAVTFNSGNDSAIHTADDAIDRIEEDALAMFLESVDAALGVLLPEREPAGVR